MVTMWHPPTGFREFRRVRTLLRQVIALAMGTVVICGCGVAQTDFPQRLMGADGQLFTLDDLEAIANNARLTDEEKREAFRDLGIEDEELIDALLGL